MTATPNRDEWARELGIDPATVPSHLGPPSAGRPRPQPSFVTLWATIAAGLSLAVLVVACVALGRVTAPTPDPRVLVVNQADFATTTSTSVTP